MTDFAVRVLTAQLGKTRIYATGQAGFIVQSAGGQLLGLDLYLSECVERVEGHMGFKRLLPKILGAEELFFDCLIATHPHYDHFDVDAIPQLMYCGTTRLFASRQCRQEVSRLMMQEDRVTYVAPKETYQTGDFQLNFVKCDHGSGAPDAVGVVVSVDGKRIYFAGDTCLHLEWAEELLADGPIQVLVAPINGAYGNLSERECAAYSNALKPDVTIPCHYGMFASHGGNPGLFYSVMTEEYPERKLMLLAQGESLVLEEPNQKGVSL